MSDDRLEPAAEHDRSDDPVELDEFDEPAPEEFDVDDDEPRPPHRKPRGTYLGAAMLGLEQAIFGKVKPDTVIQIEAAGEPPNIDLDGLDAPFGVDGRLVGPPLDQIKARARRRRRSR